MLFLEYTLHAKKFFYIPINNKSILKLITFSQSIHVLSLLCFTYFNEILFIIIQSEDLLKVTISILRAWEDPLKHMAVAVAALPDASDVMMSRTKELEERILGLLEGLQTILSRVSPLTLHISLFISYVKESICLIKSEFFSTSFLAYQFAYSLAKKERPFVDFIIFIFCTENHTQQYCQQKISGPHSNSESSFHWWSGYF